MKAINNPINPIDDPLQFFCKLKIILLFVRICVWFLNLQCIRIYCICIKNSPHLVRFLLNWSCFCNMSHNCKNNTPAKADTCPCIIKKNSVSSIYSLNTVYNYFQKTKWYARISFKFTNFLNLRGVLGYIVDKTLHMKTTQRIFLYFIAYYGILLWIYTLFSARLNSIVTCLWYSLSKQQ